MVLLGQGFGEERYAVIELSMGDQQSNASDEGHLEPVEITRWSAECVKEMGTVDVKGTSQNA